MTKKTETAEQQLAEMQEAVDGVLLHAGAAAIGPEPAGERLDALLHYIGIAIEQFRSKDELDPDFKLNRWRHDK